MTELYAQPRSLGELITACEALQHEAWLEQVCKASWYLGILFGTVLLICLVIEARRKS